MNGNILPSNEATEVEGRVYVDPSLGVTATDNFIEQLRAAQQMNAAQNAASTQALGTDAQSTLGGLGGTTSYWTSRYQTPQTNATVANLRAAAQATALNEALANEKAMWDKRYQEAYRNYQKRTWDKSNTTTNNNNTNGDVETTPDVVSGDGASTVETDPLTGKEGYYSVTDPYTGEVTDVPMDGGANETRALTYTNVSIGDMTNEKYQNEEGKTVWGWTYVLPSGTKVGIRYPKQRLVKGSDGNYYREENGAYTYLGR